MRYKLLSIILIFAFVLTSGFGCKLIPTDVKQAQQPIVLDYWRPWDETEDFRDVIAAYQALHPNIQINYRKLTPEEYEEELVNAMAEDRGPDIFSIHAAKIKEYKNKIKPLPPVIEMVFLVEKGAVKKETIPEVRQVRSITPTAVKDRFIDTVYDDVVLTVAVGGGNKSAKIFGLPLSVDTLATFYNRDLLNNAGIPTVSDYWNRQFQQDVKKLTKQNVQGEVVQSGVALGAGSNISRSSDILAALMLQNGATIFNDEITRPTFREYSRELDYFPGVDAIRFYTDFANPTKDVYTWNTDLENSLDLFMQGKVAIMFGYLYQVPLIKAQAPKLDFGIKPLLQIEGREEKHNVADYWVETVSHKSQHAEEAWDFIQFMTTREENAKMYLDATNKVTALRSLISEQMADEELGVFAEQVLNAENWYKGLDYESGYRVFEEMLDRIANDPESLEYEARIAEGKMDQTLE